MITPFVRLTVFFVAGIVLQYYFDLARYSYVIISIGVILCLFSFIKKFYKLYSCRFLFGVGLAFLLMAMGTICMSQAWQRSAWASERVGTYFVRLKDDPVDKPKTRMCRVSLLQPQSKELLVYLPKDSLSSTLKAGDCMQMQTTIEEPQPFSDDSSFDYPLYLRKQGVAGIAFVRPGAWARLENPPPASFIQKVRFKALDIRRSLLDRLTLLLSNDSHFAVAAAIMFGYKSALDRELRSAFAAVGAGHVLAVSGLHLSIVFGLVYLLLSFWGNSQRGRIVRLIILLPLLWAFAFITGLSPSVVRASIMLSLWMIGNTFFLRPFSFNTIAVAAFFMLLVNPLYLFNVGFQLSFSAVTAIVLVNPYLVALHQSNNPAIRYVWNLSCVSVSAQVGVLPLSIYYFHQFPLLFLVTNLVVVPLTSLLLIAIPSALFLSVIFGCQAWISAPINALLSLFIKSVYWLNDYPKAILTDLHIRPFDTLCIYLYLILIVLLLLKKRVVYLYLILILVAVQVFSYL